MTELARENEKLPLESLHRFNEIDEIGISFNELVDLFLSDFIFEFRQQNVLHHAFRFVHHIERIVGRLGQLSKKNYENQVVLKLFSKINVIFVFIQILS